MKRIISICTAFTLLILAICVMPTSSAQEIVSSSDSLQTEYTNKLNKLHFYFADAVETEDSVALMSTPEKTTEASRFAYIDSRDELNRAIGNMNRYSEAAGIEDEPINVTVEFKSDFENTEEYIAFQEEKKSLKTLDEVHDYRKRLTSFSKEFYRRENAENLKKLGFLDYEAMTTIDYCPFVKLEMKRDDINSSDLLRLVNDNGISNVSLAHEEEPVADSADNSSARGINDPISWDRALKETDAFDMVMVGGYDATGVKIGVLEVGVCDASFKDLKNRNIHFDTRTDYTKDRKHATQVTSVIARMAKGAELYFSNYFEEDNNLTWFIDQGCDVVNCSFGRFVSEDNDSDGIFTFHEELTGYRFDFDKVFDEQIKSSDISVVVSAGNVVTDNRNGAYNPYGYITSPGLAYNAITVGGIDCTLGFFDYDLEHDSNSCYLTRENRIKPEISAPYSYKLPSFDDGLYGTSFSAPMVTASLAISFQKYPAYAANPFWAKAALIASANETKNTSNISGSNFDPKVGAGCLSLDGLLNCEAATFIINSHETEIYPQNRMGQRLSLKKNDVIQASVTWPVTGHQKSYIIDRYITNYDVRVYNSSGGLVCASALSDFTNSEFLRYKVPKAGDYQIEIYQKSAMPAEITSEFVGLAVKIK